MYRRERLETVFLKTQHVDRGASYTLQNLQRHVPFTSLNGERVALSIFTIPIRDGRLPLTAFYRFIVTFSVNLPYYRLSFLRSFTGKKR